MLVITALQNMVHLTPQVEISSQSCCLKEDNKRRLRSLQVPDEAVGSAL